MAPQPEPRTYLTFQLGDQEYALEAPKVRQVLPLARMDAAQGTVSHAGRAVPVFDLRRAFGLPARNTRGTRLVVLQRGEEDIALMVDRVAGLLTVRDQEVEAAPSLQEQTATAFLRRIRRAFGDVTIILDIEDVMRDS